MIVVTGSVTARDDTFNEVRTLSLEHVHRSRAEPGCISHAVHVDCENPLRLVFIEQWTDRAALLAHLRCRPRANSSVRCSRSPLPPPPSSFMTRLNWKSCNAWLYCHANFILQCNIRTPRYLPIQM
jgi:quinol monooxygenase YgiN